MSEALLMKLADMALNLIAVGLERDMIVSKVKEMEANGATADDVVDALRAMRDEAIAKAQKAIDAA
jgi:hypothetical protein